MNSRMDIHLINLDRSPDRLARMQGQFAAAGLSFQRFRAVDGAAGETSRYDNYSEQACRSAWRRPLIPTQVACFASHYELWRQCRDRNRPMVVFEDDITFGPDIRGALLDAERALLRFDFVRLAALYEKPSTPVAIQGLSGGRGLFRYSNGPRGTQAYALTPAGAEHLLAAAKQWVMPVDLYQDYSWLHGLPCVGLRPYELNIETATASTIANPGPEHLGAAARVRLEIRRFADNASRLIDNHRKLPVKPSG